MWVDRKYDTVPLEEHDNQLTNERKHGSTQQHYMHYTNKR